VRGEGFRRGHGWSYRASYSVRHTLYDAQYKMSSSFLGTAVIGVEAYRFGAELGGTRGQPVGHAAFVELAGGDFDDPGNLRGDKDSVGAWRVGNSNLNVGTLKILLAALETEATFGHVFASDDVIRKPRTPNRGFVAHFGAGVFAPVFHRGSRFDLGRSRRCRRSLGA